MPIDGMPSSNQQAAFGAAGSVASTGYDRVHHKDRNSEAVDPENAVKFKNALVDMISTDATPIVDTKREKKPYEEELLYQEELKKISDYKLRSVVKPAEKPTKTKKEQEEEKQSQANMQNEETAAQYMSTADRLKAVEEDILKNFIALNAKRIVGRPKNAIEGVKVELEALKNQLLTQGLLLSDFTYLDYQTAEMIKESFLKLIKDKFYSSEETSLNVAQWVLDAKKSKSITELLALLEKDSITLSERNNLLQTFEIPDLIEIASYLNLNIDAWMGILQKESVKIQKSAQDLYIKIMEFPKIEEISLVTDNFRTARTSYLLEDNIFRKIEKYFQLMQIKNELQLRGVGKEQITEIENQARKIAWLKTISSLKEAHLNRILSSSSRDFVKMSKKIEKLTKKAKKLGYDIPSEGIKWIETGLAKLGFDTAVYKLGLLKSLQEISYEKNRDEDIKRLEKIIESLQRKLPNEIKKPS